MGASLWGDNTSATLREAVSSNACLWAADDHLISTELTDKLLCAKEMKVRI